MKLGKNDPCHCGSGNKYKKCCLAKDDAARIAELNAAAAAAKATHEGEATEADGKRVVTERRDAGAQAPRPKPTGKVQSPPIRRRAV